MANNTQQMEIDMVAISLLEMESMVSSNSSPCCIYKVPEFIGRGKEEFYRPLTVSIGPVFYKKDPKLEAMQELKRVYLKSFRLHPDNTCQSFKPYIKFVKEHEREIRECYQEEISLPSDEFIQLIVLDAAFLIYNFLCCSKFESKSVICPSKNTKHPSIHNSALVVLMNPFGRDIFLEENQLPFFVLTGIYDIAFGEVSPRRFFIDLALQYIGKLALGLGFLGQDHTSKSIIDGKIIRSIKNNATGILHLVDLLRSCCCLPFDDHNGQHKHREKGKFHDFYNAKQLSEAGVKFKLNNQSDNLFDIKFDEGNGVLKIPKLYIYIETESTLRSILLFEQCHYFDECQHFTNYVVFMDTLIDTVEDVRILVKNGILENHLGSEELCVDLFNNLTFYLYTSLSNFTYSDECKGLKDYTNRRRNRWKAILWSRYFNHPWAIISVIAALLLFILTFLQTITGFLQID